MNTDTEDGFVPNEDAKPMTEELKQLAQYELTPKEFQCDKCEKSFDAKPSLNMHKMRVHTTAGRRGAMWKRLNPDKLKQRKKSERNKAWRAKRKAMGLTTTGEYYRKSRDKFYAMGLNAKGKPFSAKTTPKARENIMIAQQERRQKEALRPKGENKHIHYVYPLPETPKETLYMSANLHFCPNCGEHLEKWHNN
jgi:hypothetical protein